MHNSSTGYLQAIWRERTVPTVLIAEIMDKTIFYDFSGQHAAADICLGKSIELRRKVT
jgi:hypothetical protein